MPGMLAEFEKRSFETKLNSYMSFCAAAYQRKSEVSQG
jgi:hypothetical protein